MYVVICVLVRLCLCLCVCVTFYTCSYMMHVSYVTSSMTIHEHIAHARARARTLTHTHLQVDFSRAYALMQKRRWSLRSCVNANPAHWHRSEVLFVCVCVRARAPARVKAARCRQAGCKVQASRHLSASPP